MTQPPPPQPTSAWSQPTPPPTGWQQPSTDSGSAWQQPAPASAPASARGRALGIASLAAAVLLVVAGVVLQLVLQLTIVGPGGIETYSIVSGASLVLRVVLAIVAVALGIVCLVQRGSGRLLAAAGIGIAAAELVGTAGFALASSIASVL